MIAVQIMKHHGLNCALIQVRPPSHASGAPLERRDPAQAGDLLLSDTALNAPEEDKFLNANVTPRTDRAGTEARPPLRMRGRLSRAARPPGPAPDRRPFSRACRLSRLDPVTFREPAGGAPGARRQRSAGSVRVIAPLTAPFDRSFDRSF